GTTIKSGVPTPAMLRDGGAGGLTALLAAVARSPDQTQRPQCGPEQDEGRRLRNGIRNVRDERNHRSRKVSIPHEGQSGDECGDVVRVEPRRRLDVSHIEGTDTTSREEELCVGGNLLKHR